MKVLERKFKGEMTEQLVRDEEKALDLAARVSVIENRPF